ncbi:MAG TPA: 3-carboxy-cis,cis-muconate cycloisomerase, partial [Candidatus Binataceae bacterium]|nr:3-carboxy-cis,cis-muconate cycloisomerase [Candidatus Binataceae bacterium]
AMRRVFSDEARVQLYLDVEAALARVQARLGIIPEEAAAEIENQAIVANIDFDRLKLQTEATGSTVLPVIEQLTALCSGEAGQYCHWGATTQDITDTATVLQIRAALDLVEDDLKAISASLAGLAERYRDALMAGRTKLQHAVPITFGFKAATMLAAIERHRARLAEIRPRVLVGQLGGAAGTLASLGAQGLQVQFLLMGELELGQPDITWHTHRDRMAEVACFLGLVTGTLGKIATDVKLMMQTEVGEVFEPAAPGRGASSTMPHKRNPVSCNYILACASMVRQNVAAMLEAMVEDHERASGAWEIEWVAVPELFALSAGALANTRGLLAGLIVDEARMRANLDLTEGMVLAEGVMMSLAKFVGRDRAHEIVSSICRDAAARNRPLADLLRQNAEISERIDRAALDKLMDPANYLGLAREMIERVLAHLAP